MRTSLNEKANESLEELKNVLKKKNQLSFNTTSNNSKELNKDISEENSKINLPGPSTSSTIYQAENIFSFRNNNNTTADNINKNTTELDDNQLSESLNITENRFFKIRPEERSLVNSNFKSSVKKKSLTLFGKRKIKTKINENINPSKKFNIENLEIDNLDKPFEGDIEDHDLQLSNLLYGPVNNQENNKNFVSLYNTHQLGPQNSLFEEVVDGFGYKSPTKDPASETKIINDQSLLGIFDLDFIFSPNSENSEDPFKSKLSIPVKTIKVDENSGTTDEYQVKDKIELGWLLSSTASNIPAEDISDELTLTDILDIPDVNFKITNLKRKLEYPKQFDNKKNKVNNNYFTEIMSSIYDRPQNGIRSHNNDENNGIINSTSNQYFTSTINPANIGSLSNIGNTCYLNSIVYTLRFAPLFLHNLHHLIDDLANINQNLNKYRMKSSSLGRNVTGLQMENTRSWSSKDLSSLEQNNFYGNNVHNNLNGNNINKFTSGSDWQHKSNQQIHVIEKLHELYKHLHQNEMVESAEPYHADKFLQAIQDVSAIFEGNQQQDAHEFLMCVLDNLRETCQSLTKSIAECPDVISNGCISLPENNEVLSPTSSNPPTGKDHLSQLNSNISNISQATSLIKNSFFSRKSKRKDESKISKNLRLQSPTKDNTQLLSEENSVLNKQMNDLTDGESKTKNCAGAQNGKDEDTLSKERLNEKIKSLGLDFFSEDFEGITVSTTKCLSCETVTEQKETMIDIAVPITQYENLDCSDKAQSFIQNSCVTREYFRGDNKYRCEQCIGYTEAIRSISYEVLPRLLVIQLSRFSGGMEKINSYLPTPFTLPCFCSKCTAENENDKLHVYKLYSVITHVGATMSVGHYIAYTCALDWSEDEYLNCPKDRRRHQAKINLSLANNANTSNINATLSSNREEKQNGLIKKIFYGRNKASSSGDMSKSVKNINSSVNNSALTNNLSKSIVNGVDKLKIMNTTCPGLTCCGTKFKNQQTNLRQNNYNDNSNSNGSSYNDLNDEYGNNPSGNKNTNLNEPIWYMCDDDKIKAMTQREFEELLSPNRKITVTPYLLFYARKTLNGNNKEDNSD